MPARLRVVVEILSSCWRISILFLQKILKAIKKIFGRYLDKEKSHSRYQQRWSWGPRPRTQKKSEAKNSLSEDRHSRGQGQECSRPRPKTKDIAASVKKRSSKKIFRRSPIHRRSKNFWFGGPNHKSNAMTSSKVFKSGTFWVTKIS